MAEGVYSNYYTKCRGTLTCKCGAKASLCITPLPGRGSQFVDGHQCKACHKITTLRVFGDGRIEGEGVKQKIKKIVPPTSPPASSMRGKWK